jgi:tetratricopeptide (TPR) repeat protein
MEDSHVTRELLLGAFRGELPTAFVAQVGLQHLLGLCPRCRREFEAFRRQIGAESAKADAGLVSAALALQVTHLEEEHRRAERDLRDLLALDQEERPGRIQRSRSRFRGGHLVHLLLERGQERLALDTGEALHLTELAYFVLQHSQLGRETMELLALTYASLGNASRVAGDRRRAAEYFGQARYLVTRHAVTDAGLLARIDDLEGSLRKDQRLFEQAERLFSRSALLYTMAEARVELARVLLNLASTYNLQGNVGRALDTARSALAELSREKEPRLYLSGRYNLALFLVDSGEPGQAEQVLEEDADLYKRYQEPWLQLRLAGLRGKIAAARGDFATAETAFLEMRDGFLEQGIGFDAAIVSMDLALLYLRQGRTAELKALAREMLPIFRSQDVHREAVAALVLFQEAVREEQITTVFVRELAAYLDQARTDPSLRFR